MQNHFEKYRGRIDGLFQRKTKELDVRVVDYEFSDNKDLHVLAKRESDESYIGWTSYYTGEENTSYVDFYNGMYDMDKSEGMKELERRTDKDLGFFDKVEVDIGNNEVYVIEGLQQDVEVNHFLDEYFTEEVYEKVESFIEEHGIDPLESDSGIVKVLEHEDVVLYDKTRGIIGDVADFKLPHDFDRDDMLTKRETEQVIVDFHEECTRFWENEQKRGDDFALEHNPNELAVKDIASLERDPNEPKGKLLNEEVKESWLSIKNKEFEVGESVRNIKKYQSGMER